MYFSEHICCSLGPVCTPRWYFLEAAADGGGAGEVMVRTVGSCGDDRLCGMVSLVQFCCLNVLQT